MKQYKIILKNWNKNQTLQKNFNLILNKIYQSILLNKLMILIIHIQNWKIFELLIKKNKN